jgi:hypothetical protein
MPSGLAGGPPGSQLGACSLPVPPEWLDALAELVAERLRDELPERSSPWLTRPLLAARLGVPLSRIEKDRTIPCHRWEGRVLYHVGEVDEWLRSQ